MDMSGDHAIALMGVLFLPVAVIPVLLALQILAVRFPFAGMLWSRIDGAEPMTRLASLLLLAMADIHLTLVPVHLGEQPITGVLFLLDGIALTAVALAAFATPRWRAAAVVLLIANILAYGLYLGAGWEGADIVGVGTKLVELAGVVVVLRSYRDASAPARSKVARVSRRLISVSEGWDGPGSSAVLRQRAMRRLAWRRRFRSDFEGCLTSADLHPVLVGKRHLLRWILETRGHEHRTQSRKQRSLRGARRTIGRAHR